MSTHLRRAPKRERAVACTCTAAIERRLSSFRPEIQARVRSVAARHPWIADLAVSFPALLFAMARPFRGVDSAHATRLATDGAALARLALETGVPLWMRSFPPQAFAAPFPALPDGPEFRRRIANHFPSKWSDAPLWIETVALAGRWGDDDIALWFAREAPRVEPRKPRRAPRPSDHRRLVCLWAWFSAHVRDGAAAAIATHFTPEMKWKQPLKQLSRGMMG